jgi:hypothetical protein
MRGLRIPSFARSRSSDSRDEAARRDDETDRAETNNNEDAEGRLCEGRQPAKTLGGRISFWKRKSANITDYDPTYRVVYLGNVLTGWAKGERISQSLTFVQFCIKVHTFLFKNRYLIKSRKESRKE